MGKLIRMQLPLTKGARGARHAQGWAQLQARDRRASRALFWRRVAKGAVLVIIFALCAWLAGG